MKTYEVTILCNIAVEAFSETDAEYRAVEQVMDCVDWCEVKSIECFDDEDE